MHHTPITGYSDPPSQAPWAMQLIINVDKTHPPTRTSACQSVATAVVALLDDERCQPGGPWQQPVARWSAGRIRKHVRRARASAWQSTHNVPGITVTVGHTQVRALVPGPVDAIPPMIAKLQLSGLHLPDPNPHVVLPAVTPGTLLIAVTPEPRLSDGKAAAAAGHAAQLAAANVGTTTAEHWKRAGYPMVVIQPDQHLWNNCVAHADVTVTDAGFTEVVGGTVTACATRQ